jgi:hypothetical protein
MKLIRRLILLAAIAAGAAYVKQLLDEQQGDAQPSDSPPSPPAASPPASSTNGSKGATKAELYEQAQELGIEGRSKMTKAELERAIRSAG